MKDGGIVDIKKLTARVKISEENDGKRENQYRTMFKEFKKIKSRIQFLESERYNQNQETEKHFDHIENELISMQSTMDFFTGEGEGEITGHEEEKEDEITIEEEKPRRLIMGLDFSDWKLIGGKLLPKDTKTSAK